MLEKGALQEVKNQASSDMRQDMAVAVTDFMSQPETVKGLAQKLISSESLPQEIGRNATMIASRACQQAKSQGVQPPQSALWIPPGENTGLGGAVAVAIQNQVDMAKQLGLTSVEEESDLVTESFMHAVKEGMRDPALAEGASVYAEGFDAEGKQQESRNPRGLLAQLTGSPTGQSSGPLLGGG